MHVRLSVCVVSILIFSDFDDDGTLDCGDLEKLVNCLTGETDDTRLTPEEMRQLINNVSSPRHLLFEDVGRQLKQCVVAGGYTGASVGTTVVFFACFLDS